ncbi:cytochrome P450 4V2 [Trichonephila clavipes]|nr:cytochrome P450 4V2 [Trichonephila clavipes]
MRSKDGITEPLPNGNLNHRKKRKAFLELLLEHHLKDPSFTEEDIGMEVDTFMFAGHDTTAMALSWVLYCLGQNPKIQQKVQEELDDIFEDDIDRNIVLEDLTKMKYLECVIKVFIYLVTEFDCPRIITSTIARLRTEHLKGRKIHPDKVQCKHCPDLQLTPNHILECPTVATKLLKMGMVPLRDSLRELLYSPDAPRIAEAVIKTFDGI